MAEAPKTFLLWLCPDGRQLVQVDGLTTSIPKDTDKYYHARINIRGEDSAVRVILYNPRRHRRIDGSGYTDSVYILIDQRNISVVTVDAIQGATILGELSQAEYEAVAADIRNMTDRDR